MTFNNDDISEFNSGLAIIYQLDGIEKGMVDACLLKDYERYYELLFAYMRILYQFMTKGTDNKEGEREKHVAMWKKIQNNLYKIKEMKGKGKGIPLELINEFNYWEMELRDIKHKHGLGMPAKDPRYVGTKR